MENLRTEAIVPGVGIAGDGHLRAVVHVWIVVSTMATVGAGLAAWGWLLGPAVGDLTRIGGLSERDFGWSGAVRAPRGVDRRLLSQDELFGGADPGDVLIFGDSFSMPSQSDTDWGAQLAANRGLRVRVVLCQDFALAARWAMTEGLERPRAVIMESAQRLVGSRALGAWQAHGACAAPGPVLPLVLPNISGAHPGTSLVHRRTGFESMDELMSRGVTAIRVRLFGGTQSVLALPLTCDGTGPTFSCRSRCTLLVLEDDVVNQSAKAWKQFGVPPEHAAERVGCALRQLLTVLDGAGVPVLFMIAPDKTWAYEPWITRRMDDPCVDLFTEAHRALGGRVVEIMEPLRSAIGRGEADVYWPDDTHWGPAGAFIAAEAVAMTLEQRKR